MACLETDAADGCPDGHYRCPTCGGRRTVCKPCKGAAARARAAAATVPENWSYCSAKGESPVLCVPMGAFPDDSDAAEWFRTQGRSGRVRIVRVDEPDAVTWGEPTSAETWAST